MPRISDKLQIFLVSSILFLTSSSFVLVVSIFFLTGSVFFKLNFSFVSQFWVFVYHVRNWIVTSYDPVSKVIKMQIVTATRTQREPPNRLVTEV